MATKKKTAAVGDKVEVRNDLKVTVAGRDFVLARQNLLFADLEPDPANPRYAKPDGSMYPLEELLTKLRTETNTKDLARSILDNGLVEPLMVRKVDKKYIVKEGNRRYMAWESILTQLDAQIAEKFVGAEAKKAQFLRVPCYVIPPEMDDAHFSAYLGILHVQGKVVWDKYSRAMYIAKLTNMWGKDRVIDMLGVKKRELTETLHTIEIASAYCKATGVTDPTPVYWHMYEFGRLKDVRDDKEARAVFFDAVKAGKFRDSVNVRQFPAVWKSEAAREVFMTHPSPKEALGKAMEAVKEEDPAAIKRSAFEMFTKVTDKVESEYLDVLETVSKSEAAQREYMSMMKVLIGVGVRARLSLDLSKLITA